VKKRGEEILQSARREGKGTVAAELMTLQAIKTAALKQIYWEKGAL
jgi:hypothetical protein